MSKKKQKLNLTRTETVLIYLYVYIIYCTNCKLLQFSIALKHKFFPFLYKKCPSLFYHHDNGMYIKSYTRFT